MLFSFNPATGEFVAPPHLAGDFRHEDEPFAAPRVAGVTAQVLRDGILLVPDLAKQPAYASTVTDREGVHAYIAVRIATPRRKHPLSVLFVNYLQPRDSFLDTDVTALRQFADRMAGPLHEAWSFVRYEHVIRIGNAINHKLATVEELFENLREQLSHTINTSHWLGMGVVKPGSHHLDIYNSRPSVSEHGVLRNVPLNRACAEAIIADRILGPDAVDFSRFDLPVDGTARSNIFAPFTLREAALGFLLVQHPDEHTFDAEDLHIVEILANHVSTALHGIEVFDALETLRTVGALLTSDIQIADVQKVIAKGILDATQADLILLYSYRNETEAFEGPPLIFGELMDPHYVQPAFSPGDLPTSAVVLAEPQFADAASDLPGMLRSDRTSSLFQQREKIASAVAVPLHVFGEPVGVLFVNYRQPQRFDGVKKRLIQALGVFSAIAIENTRVYAQQRNLHASELALIREVDRKINKSNSLQEMLDVIVEGANRVIKADRATLMLASADGKQLQVKAAVSTTGKPYHIGDTLSVEGGQGISGAAFKARRPIRANDIWNTPQWQTMYVDTGDGMQSELDVPLLVEREVPGDAEVVGVLNFESTRPAGFTQHHGDFAELLAGQVVMAVKKADDFERLEESRANAGRQLKRFKALRDLGELLGELNEEQRAGVFQLTVRRAADECECFAVARAFDKTRRQFVLVATAGEGVKPYPAIPETDSAYKRVLAQMDAVNFEDIDAAQLDEPINLSDERTRSLLVAPVHMGGELLGSIGMSHVEPRHFGPEDVELIQGMAKLLAVTLVRIDSAKHEKELLEQNTQAMILSSMGDAAIHLAHRLNGDLSQINAFLNFAREAVAVGDGDGVEEQFRYIYEAVAQVLEYANQLQEHITTRTSSPPTDVRLARIIGDLTTHYASRCTIANQATDTSLIVRSVADDVIMIFQNLFDNAVQSASKRVSIEITARRSGSLVEVEFADDGPGIDPKDREHIFKFGFTTKKAGTGWGLWKAKATARFHHGDLELLDGDRGARFLVKFRTPSTEVPLAT